MQWRKSAVRANTNGQAKPPYARRNEVLRVALGSRTIIGTVVSPALAVVSSCHSAAHEQ
jgi:hypothetical protein